MNDQVHPVVLKLRRFASRVGHDLVWLSIALLFCLVETAVLVTELRPSRLFRTRLRTPLAAAADFQAESAVPQT